ncbi:MAG: T9SS type A sorting domain-containing protein [Bacteroidetes bacterium]|nr:T9SS type A sorting domain-containing protein [Bacteroidota bacterium]
MKLLKQLIIFSLLMISIPTANAQYQMILQNDTEINGNEYEFDVFIVSTSGSFNLTSYQVCFTFNNAIINGGSLSFNYIDGSTALSSCLPLSTQIIDDSGILNLICGSNFGSQTVTTTQLKIGRFRISNSAAFTHTTADIVWDFSGDLVTEVNISNINVTSPSNHINLLGNNPLPVELVEFIGNSIGSDVELKWKTATEINNFGFDVERSVQADQSFAGNKKSKPESWTKIGFVMGSGNSNSVKEYSFKDQNPEGGNKFNYRLKQIDINGNYKYSSIATVEVLPKEFSLLQNYPNPFNPTTFIRYELPRSEFVSLKIYDVLGKEVKILINENQNAGRYEVMLNAGNLASGIYVYQIAAGKFTSVKKMLLIK